MTIDYIKKLPLKIESIDEIEMFINSNKEFHNEDYFFSSLFLAKLYFTLDKDSEGMHVFLEVYNDRNIKKYTNCYLEAIEVIIEYYIERRQFREAKEFIEEKKKNVSTDKRFSWKLDLISIYIELERYNDAKNHIVDINPKILIGKDLYRYNIYNAIIQIKQGNYEIALSNLLDVKNASIVDNNNDYYNEAYFYELLIRFKKNKEDNIINDAEEILAYEDEIKRDTICRTQTLIIEYLYEIGNYKKATIYSTEYEESIEKAKNPLIKRNYYSLLTKLYKETNDSYTLLYYEDKLKEINITIDKQNSHFIDKQPKVKTTKVKETPEIKFHQEEILKKETNTVKDRSFDELYRSVDFMEQILKCVLETENDDLREYFRQTMIKITDYIVFDEAVLAMIDDDNVNLYYYKKGLAYDYCKDVSLIDKTIIGHVIIENDDQVYTDSLLDTTIEVIHQKTCSNLGFEAVMGFPISDYNKAIGAIAFYGNKNMAYQDLNYELLRFFSKALNYYLLNDIKFKHFKKNNFIYKSSFTNSLSMQKYSIENEVTINQTLSDLIHLKKKITYGEYFTKIHVDDINKYKEAIKELNCKMINRAVIEYRLENLWVRESINVISNGDVPILISNYENIQDYKELKNKKYEEVTYDFLTHLKTRKLAIEKLEECIKKNKFSLILIDIDNFRSFNDVYGHAFGDLLLESFAKRINENLLYDSFRLESDQVLIIIDDTNDLRTINKKATELVSYLEYNLPLDNPRFKVKFSVGLFRYPVQSRDKNPERILKLVDMAHYKAKKNKKYQKSSIENYDQNDYKNDCFEQLLITHVSEAIDNNLLEVKYQQVIDIKKGTVLHYEAKTNIQNYSVTDKYVHDISVKRGIIINLDKYLIKNSLDEIKEIFEKTKKYIKVSMEINQRTFMQDSFSSFLLAELQKRKIHPSVIILEIENEIPNLFDISKKLMELKKNGIKTIINRVEDIVKINADYLKIDDINDYLDNDYSITTLENLNEMLKKLNIGLIIGSIEKKETLARIKNSSISYVEGTCYGKRLTKNDILEKMIRSDN